jgi:putative transposase
VIFSIIDIFNKKLINYHIGYSCKASDLKFTFLEAIKLLKPNLEQLVIRSDNGPQMTSNQFNDYVTSIGLDHEFIPVRTPNKNAFIESFFSIYEIQFLQVRYFRNLKDVYIETEEFINFYNNERLHGSLGYIPPSEFDKNFNMGLVKNLVVSC